MMFDLWPHLKCQKSFRLVWHIPAARLVVSDRIPTARVTAALRDFLHMLFMRGSDVNVLERLIGSDTIASVSVVLPLWVSQAHATRKTSSPVGFWGTVQSGWNPGISLAVWIVVCGASELSCFVSTNHFAAAVVHIRLGQTGLSGCLGGL